MSYTNSEDHLYDYNKDLDIGFVENSSLPVVNNLVSWEYHLPLAPSSKD